jgi:hypothetical protein
MTTKRTGRHCEKRSAEAIFTLSAGTSVGLRAASYGRAVTSRVRSHDRPHAFISLGRGDRQDIRQPPGQPEGLTHSQRSASKAHRHVAPCGVIQSVNRGMVFVNGKSVLAAARRSWGSTTRGRATGTGARLELRGATPRVADAWCGGGPLPLPLWHRPGELGLIPSGRSSAAPSRARSAYCAAGTEPRLRGGRHVRTQYEQAYVRVMLSPFRVAAQAVGASPCGCP